jgi:putative membrane-bound dehydrogenase-like protein
MHARFILPLSARTRLAFACPLLLALLLGAAPTRAEEPTAGLPSGVTNSQAPQDVPGTPQEALAKTSVPEGFRVSLFAGEPAVQQPIGFAIDDRGRLWVAECYSYNEWIEAPNKGHDRIVLLEDTDGDGTFDKRKIFREGLSNLTGIEVGFGGVWALCAPQMLFFPDADGDDTPDGPPVVKLEGWTLKARHNIVNGLTWGPDGWLYGCHGILDESRVGVPGSPVEKRPPINCGIWRYHPATQQYEPVCHGTTNPWGIDFDAYGEAFFVNCVIGHLWHMIPGAHYKRMFGRPYIAHAYELIDAHSDHLHWVGSDWHLARGGEAHDAPGGGHAHCGLMVYLGDNFPAEYRGRAMMNNIHGNRVNVDILRPEGSGYVAEHGDDFFFANDPWFRGVALKYGPDGGVYIADWTDLGECHDSDGVHRSSGRIYKVVYGQTEKTPELNISQASNEQLVAWHDHPNQWYYNHARRVLQERALAGDDMTGVRKALQQKFANSKSSPERLRAMWTLYATGGLDEAALLKLLAHEDAYVRGWSVRLLGNSSTHSDARRSRIVPFGDRGTLSEAARSRLVEMAVGEPAAHVRLNLASALQRMPIESRWDLASALLSHAEDAEDHNLPLMIWYGIEPAVATDKIAAVKLIATAKIPRVRQFIAKRLAEATE